MSDPERIETNAKSEWIHRSEEVMPYSRHAWSASVDGDLRVALVVHYYHGPPERGGTYRGMTLGLYVYLGGRSIVIPAETLRPEDVARICRDAC